MARELRLNEPFNKFSLQSERPMRMRAGEQVGSSLSVMVWRA